MCQHNCCQHFGRFQIRPFQHILVSVKDACHDASPGWWAGSVCMSLNLSCTSLLHKAPSGSVRRVCIRPKTDIHRSCNSSITRLPSMFPTCCEFCGFIDAYLPGGLASSQALQRSNLAAASAFSLAPFHRNIRDWEDGHNCDEAFVSTTQVCASHWMAWRTGLPHHVHSNSLLPRSKLVST